MSKSKYLIFISTALLMLSVVLHWRIPRSSELGVIGYFIFNVFFVGLFGIVISGLSLWKRRFSRDLKSVLILFSSFVLIPIVLGPYLNAFITTGLYSYYDSNFFINKYVNRLGVTVTSQGQSFEYAYCRIEKYSARYKIKASKESELIFVLVDKNGVSYDRFDDSISNPLKKIFLYKKGAFIARELAKTLGVFQIPAGEYEFTIISKQPFLLAIYDNKPLITPALIILGEEDYQRIYSDNFSQNEIDLETQDIKTKSCNKKQTTHQPENGDYFLNKYVYIPNAKINLYADNAVKGKGTEEALYLYNQWPGNSNLNESLLLEITDTPREKLIIVPSPPIYRTIINKFTGQKLNIYLTTIKKDDPHRPPYLPSIDYSNFMSQIENKAKLSEDDLQYLNRTDSYFWVDKPIQIKGFSLYFNDRISPFDIEKVLEIIEVIEPSQIYVKNTEIH